MVIIKMHSARIVLIALFLFPGSAFGQTYQEMYQYLITEGRTWTLARCNLGRKLNKLDVSNWDLNRVLREEANAIKDGYTKESANIRSSAVATAMNEVCPDVW